MNILSKFNENQLDTFNCDLSLNMHYFVSFLKFCNYLDEEERAGFIALIVLCLATVNVLWLFLTVPWVAGLQCVIVVFSYHTHLLFGQ